MIKGSGLPATELLDHSDRPESNDHDYEKCSRPSEAENYSFAAGHPSECNTRQLARSRRSVFRKAAVSIDI